MLSQLTQLVKRSAADTKGIGCGVCNDSETSGSMPNTSNELATRLAELEARASRIETRLCQLMIHLGANPYEKQYEAHHAYSKRNSSWG
jgi:hypothetical protein